MQLKTPHEVLGQGDAERLVELLGELAVLEALGEAREVQRVLDGQLATMASHLQRSQSHTRTLVEEFNKQLRADGVGWRQELEARCRAVPSARLRVWLADSCIGSSFLDEELLTGGPIMRRLDAVLDIAGVPFCAADVQGTAAAIACELADAQVPDGLRASSKAAVYGAYFAGGWFALPVAGAAAEAGRTYLLEHLSQPTSLVAMTTRSVVAATAAMDGEHAAPEVGTILRYLDNEVLRVARQAAASSTEPSWARTVLESTSVVGWLGSRAVRAATDEGAARARVLAAAAAQVRQLQGEATIDDVPEVVGLSVSAASKLLKEQGFTVRTLSEFGHELLANERKALVIKQKSYAQDVVVLFAR